MASVEVSTLTAWGLPAIGSLSAVVWYFIRDSRKRQQARDDKQDSEIAEMRKNYVTRPELDRIVDSVTLAIEAGFKNQEKWQEKLIEVEVVKLQQHLTEAISCHELKYHMGKE